MNPYSPEAFFDLEDQAVSDFFKDYVHVWDAVAGIPAFVEKNFTPEIKGEVEEGAWLEPGRVSLGEGSRVERGCVIRGPVIIGKNTVIRSGVYIRGNVYIGEDCLIGWSVEMRQSIILSKTRIPHFNAIFTSLIGSRINLAGRVSTANYRLDGREVTVKVPVGDSIESFPTGQTLFGAVVGDDTQIAGNALLQPGTIVGRRCIIYPHIDVSGYIPHDSFVKRKETPFYIEPRRG